MDSCCGYDDLQGIPWYYKPGCDTTLLYCVQRVTGFALRAGNAAVVFVFIGFIFQYIATFALYTRWGGRSSFIPHGPIVRSPDSAVCAFDTAQVSAL